MKNVKIRVKINVIDNQYNLNDVWKNEVPKNNVAKICARSFDKEYLLIMINLLT